MRYILLIVLGFSFMLLLNSCSIHKRVLKSSLYCAKNFSLKDDINKSILDGFYNNSDTIGKSIYLLK